MKQTQLTCQNNCKCECKYQNIKLVWTHCLPRNLWLGVEKLLPFVHYTQLQPPKFSLKMKKWREILCKFLAFVYFLWQNNTDAQSSIINTLHIKHVIVINTTSNSLWKLHWHCILGSFRKSSLIWKCHCTELTLAC